MNGAFHAPPLTVPSVFADRQSRRESPKMASRPFQFLEKNAPKSERERPSTLRDWPPCPPIQRDGGWWSRPGVNPFISALTVARCLADFPGVWPQLRDILNCSPSSGQRNKIQNSVRRPCIGCRPPWAYEPPVAAEGGRNCNRQCTPGSFCSAAPGW